MPPLSPPPPGAPELPAGFAIADRTEPLAEFVLRRGREFASDGRYEDWAAVNPKHLPAGYKVLVPETPEFRRRYAAAYNYVIARANEAEWSSPVAPAASVATVAPHHFRRHCMAWFVEDPSERKRD